ncbi:MAG: glycosyltransferase, partial [Mariprofundaceae bacterium]|nr:glycosyltransferase [Mariprofundaceae bacterium]
MPKGMQPSIAIIIPVYNEAKVLPQALTMLRALSVEEIIFVDGGSTDESRVLIEDAGFSCMSSAAGRAKQMNAG